MIDGTGRLTNRPHRTTTTCRLLRRDLLRRNLTHRWVAANAVKLSVLYLVAVGCSERTQVSRLGGGISWSGSAPDELPQIMNATLPFRYPAAVYRRRIQGNVTLRLYVDASGSVIPDSTRVAEPSGQPLLDSAAVAGAGQLHFRPARRRSVAIAVVMLFPVHFRHPEVPRLPGDSL